LYFISQSQYLLSLPLVGLLALTFSRASYLSFLIGTIFLLISKKKIKYLLLLVLLSVVIYLIPKPSGEGVNLLRTFSIFSRIDSWQQGLSLFAERPIFGWGYNTLRNIDGSRFQIDNSFIYILATTGIAGFLSFIYLVQKILVNTKNKGIKLLFISLLIHSLFNNTLFYIWILALAMITLGLGQEKTKEYKST